MPDIIQFGRWEDVPTIKWPGRHFKPRELACRLTGGIRFDLEFLAILDVIRDELTKLLGEQEGQLVISSGYRSPQHNFEVTGKISGAHVDGQAADILCHGHRADLIDRIAVQAGVVGRGWRQHGPVSSRYIHLDVWHRRPKSLNWTYPK